MIENLNLDHCLKKEKRMILTGNAIKESIKNGDIVISPFNESQLNPNSYNLKLGNKLIEYSSTFLDMKRKPNTNEIEIPTHGYKLLPGHLYLGHTEEYTETYNLVPRIEGRSSIGRLGISIHCSNGFGDIGFKGQWTLCMTASVPVIIYPGIEICQIYYSTIYGDIAEYNSKKYQNSVGINPSKLYMDFNK